MTTFAVRLKELRKERGLTQNKLAKKIYISKPTVCAYENGYRIPRADVVVDFARFFNVSADYLLGMSDRKESL
jgi:transcriptional regulator with XRE-family HTH domain